MKQQDDIRRPRTAIAAVLVMAVVPLAAMAQLAPMGAHYAARSSDSGFEGSVNSQGGYGASVPLDLPPVHGDLPVPLQIVYGGARVGAVGLSWDIPLSFIRRDTSIAYRRPANDPDAAPQAREQLSLVLNGERTDLVRNAANTAWVARRNGPQFEVRDAGSGSYVMYDGEGRTYSFSAEGGVAGSRLDGGKFSLLRNITGASGTNVHLEYDFGAPAIPGGGSGLAINLASVSYNKHPTEPCFKHKIVLNYDSAMTGVPLAVSVLGSTVLARVQKLSSVDVLSKPTCAESDQSLRKYTFTYQNDVDTQRPQLQQVTVIGQQGTPERSVTLPVATYSYGQVTGADGKLSYRQTEKIPTAQLPGFDPGFGIAGTFSKAPDPENARFHSTESFTIRNLVDVNGDGRADLGYSQGAAINAPVSGTGKSQLTHSAGFSGGFSSLQVSTEPRQVDNNVNEDGSRNRTFTQPIDFNGDGRVDVIRADEVAGAWVVYLNTPDPSDPRKNLFVRREIDVAPIVQHLTAAGHDLASTPIGFPLAQTATVQDRLFNQCWEWADPVEPGQFRWVLTIAGYSGPANNRCTAPQGQLAVRDDYDSIDLPAKTITEWELRDINGDGYPDFVYNAAPVDIVLRETNAPNPPPEQGGAFVGQFAMTQKRKISDIHGSTDVRVLFNVAGTHLQAGVDETLIDPNTDFPFQSLVEGTNAFSAPVTLETVAPPGVNVPQACGVGRWGQDASVAAGDAVQVQMQECGFDDVNGDGLVDRILKTPTPDGFSITARLGTGDMSVPFSTATVRLPGPTARVESVLVKTDELGHFKPFACPTTPTPKPPGAPFFAFPLDTYSTQRIAGLRDINGDGVPDYIVGFNPPPVDTTPAPTAWTVAFGTGNGFAPPRAVDSPVGLELSFERAGCFSDNTSAKTTTGVYELDGDGLPEVVQLDVNNDLVVYKLNTSRVGNDDVPTPPTSGRLTRIANGYGAVTHIGYRSAKEDPSTRHQLPFPEIVVTEVATRDATTGAALASPALYAYGSAEQIFDPADDQFRFPGYLRAVTLRNDGNALNPAAGVASISDMYGLPAFNENDTGMTANARFKRYLQTGKIADVTTLAGDFGTDVWALLSTNVVNDTRRISGAHYTWDTRLLAPGLGGNESCLDMVFPFDFDRSNQYKLNHASDSFDQCAQRGFVFQKSDIAWRGTPGTSDPLTTDRTVKTSSEVDAIDDLGRITRTIDDGDLVRADDDLCTQTTYAEPMGSNERMLVAPASQTTTNCGQTDATRITLTQETWEYDTTAAGAKLPAGRVAAGFVTSQVVSRRNAVTGTPIVDALGSSDIRLFDAVFDANGNPISITKRRDDGATQKFTASYDAFGLVATSVTADATNADGTKPPLMTTSFTFDPVTLAATSGTEPNGAVSSNTFDGFGRVLLSKVRPVGGSEGVLSSMTYNGFDFGQAGGRNIVLKVFTDPVEAANVGTTAGRISTTFLDSLGREQRTEVALGADYSDKKLVVGQRVYDALGRVLFEADPFPSTDSFSTAYGTTQYFNGDGSPSCTIRGRGQQPPGTSTTDESLERYPTCFGRSFFANKEVVVTRDALTNLGASDMQRETKISAIGDVLEHSTKANGELPLEFSQYDYDALGNMKSMKRFQTAGGNPIITRWQHDSLGRVIRLEEPGSELATPVNAPQNRTYSSWGELTQLQWNDPTISGPAGNDRRTILRYDALGRLTHSEDQTNGISDAATINDYVYDVGFNITTPAVTATNVIGRMTKAIAPTSSVTFSYDGLGQIKAKTFTDTDVASTQNYVEKHDFHADGSLLRSQLLLPDNAFKVEQIDYSYDSAGHMRSVKYNDGTNKDLFIATGVGDLDVFGRIRSAKYGLALYTADYADTGRRLLSRIKLASPGPMTTSREIAFPVVAGTVDTPFDPLGRERVRRETRDGVVSPFATLSSYSPLGQLAASSKLQVSTGVASADRTFAYDPLGNLLTQTDAAAATPSGKVTMSYQSVDRDRICSIGYGSTPPPATCNVKYDGVGNIVEMPTRSSGLRTFAYNASGQTKSIVNGATNARYKYDAFGAVQQLDVNSPSSTDTRRDKHFGDMISLRRTNSASTLERKIAAPGMVATRHGKAGGWTLAHSEGRGTRFTTDYNGAFMQDLDYQPYGEVKPASITLPGTFPGSPDYTREQWNGGDALAALGVSQLGARIYDPVIGRFMSRDPLILPRTAATSNPYAFADNDPVNFSDPTGLVAGLARQFDENGNDHGLNGTSSYLALGTVIPNRSYATDRSNCSDEDASCSGLDKPVPPAQEYEISEAEEIDSAIADKLTEDLLPSAELNVQDFADFEGPGAWGESLQMGLVDGLTQAAGPGNLQGRANPGPAQYHPVKSPRSVKLSAPLGSPRLLSKGNIQIAHAKDAVIIGVVTDDVTNGIAKAAKHARKYHKGEVLVLGHGGTWSNGQLNGDIAGLSTAQVIRLGNMAKIHMALKGVKATRLTLGVCGSACGDVRAIAAGTGLPVVSAIGTTSVNDAFARRRMRVTLPVIQ